MRGKRDTEEQIIGILKEHEAGMPAQEVIRKHGIANGTFYRWKRGSVAWRSRRPSGCGSLRPRTPG
jgi:DNA invertase Pin-like site-specific DNA recombinase